MKLKIKFSSDPYELEKHGDWIDLKTIQEETLLYGQLKYLSLGVSIELPKGYEALVVPRSSTPKNFGIILANSIGIIDESYCGDEDVWHFPAFCIWKKTIIPKGVRICQFRLIEHQPHFDIQYCEKLGNKNRNGLGSTGL